MLSFAVRHLSTKVLARTLQRSALSESKFPQRINCTRYFSSTPTLKQADAAAPPVSDTVAERVVDISSTSDVTISKIAEGLSSDLLAASGITPTLQDMGLGSYWTPAGLVQNLLDMLHNAGLPWWAAIASTTLVMRLLLFPLVVDSQRASIAYRNKIPEITKIQERISDAKLSGNAIEVSRASLAMQSIVKDANPLKPMKIGAVQIPLFISFYFGLKGMANLPMESMKTGGIFWFTDLTVPDPHYILPLTTCATVFLMIRTGADGITATGVSKTVSYGLKVMPVIIFPLIYNFPAAVLCYWTTSNFFSLAQVILLKRPAMRKRFNLPAEVIPEKSDAPKSKGFMKDMNESYNNMKLSREVANRARLDEMRFRKSGSGAVLKTFRRPQQLQSKADN